MNEIIISDEQQEAVDRIKTWAEHHGETSWGNEFKLGGYAGTGKTTVIKEVIKAVQTVTQYEPGDGTDRYNFESIGVGAFTGKAVSVLRKKGISSAETLHSMLYIPRTTKDGKVEFVKRDSLEYDLVIVDEASMISTELYDDLTSFGVPILWVGDPGQLEPVGNDIQLMKKPDFVLQKIHRQGEGSSILEYANRCRMGHPPFMWKTPPTVELEVRKRATSTLDIENFDQIICGFNKTRVAVNKQVRRQLCYDEKKLNIGERIVCLRNERLQGVFNGMLLIVTEVEPFNPQGTILKIKGKDELGRELGPLFLWSGQFNTIELMDNRDLKIQSSYAKKDLVLFDYGYCLTAHKSQGSEWDSVAVIEEIWAEKWSPARWRYTAITRAAKKLLYFYR